MMMANPFGLALLTQDPISQRLDGYSSFPGEKLDWEYIRISRFNVDVLEDNLEMEGN